MYAPIPVAKALEQRSDRLTDLLQRMQIAAENAYRIFLSSVY
jgi:hypothetical protein